jgi:hypothetical protein
MLNLDLLMMRMKLLEKMLLNIVFFEEFGYDKTKNLNIYETISDEIDEWENDDYDYITNEDELISFLNEYYIIYPKKLPKQQFK